MKQKEEIEKIKKIDKKFKYVLKQAIEETKLSPRKLEDIYQNKIKNIDLDINKHKFDFYSLSVVYSDYKRIVPLRVIVILCERLKDEHFKETLLNLWYMRHKCEKKKRIDAFWEMSDEDLAWVFNNLDKLLIMSNNEVIFCTYVSMLNKQGIVTLEYRIKELFRRMDLKISDKYLKDNNVIFPDINSRYSFIAKYSPEERLQYLVEISEKEDLLKIKNLDERMLRCDLWTCFHSLDDERKKLLSFFYELGTREQSVLIATIILLEMDNAYLKEEYRPF